MLRNNDVISCKILALSSDILNSFFFITLSLFLLDCFWEVIDDELPRRFSRFWLPPLGVADDFGGSIGGNPPNAAIYNIQDS